MPESIQNLEELHQERAKLIQEARDFAEKNLDMSGDQKVKFDEMLSKADALELRIKTEMDLRQREKTVEDVVRKTPGPVKRGVEETLRQLRNVLRTGREDDSLPPLVEARALQAYGDDTQAGYLVLPEVMVDLIIKEADDDLFMGGLARIIRVEGLRDLGVISRDTRPDDFDWTTELKIGGEENSLKFGKRHFRARPYRKLLKVSKDLLEADTAINIEEFIAGEFAYIKALTGEKAYISGDGQKEPLGCMTVSGDGIPASRDIDGGNTSTEVTFEGLITAKFNLKSQYLRNASILGHRDMFKQIALEVDGQGQYIWQPSKRLGEPDQVLGIPIFISEYMPNTFTTGLNVGIIGDFSKYWILDSKTLSIQVLLEKYADTNQNGYIFKAAGDGMPVLSEAFTRIKLA